MVWERSQRCHPSLNRGGGLRYHLPSIYNAALFLLPWQFHNHSDLGSCDQNRPFQTSRLIDEKWLKQHAHWSGGRITMIWMTENLHRHWRSLVLTWFLIFSVVVFFFFKMWLCFALQGHSINNLVMVTKWSRLDDNTFFYVTVTAIFGEDHRLYTSHELPLANLKVSHIQQRE